MKSILPMAQDFSVSGKSSLYQEVLFPTFLDMKRLCFCLLSLLVGGGISLPAQQTPKNLPRSGGESFDSTTKLTSEQPKTFGLEEPQKVAWPPDSVESDPAKGFSNPFAGKYFISPSAIPLEKGEPYYQNVLLGVNTIRYGITDQFSLAGGMEVFTLLYTLFGNDSRILTGFASVNWSTPVKDRWWVGGSLMGGAVDEYHQIGILYGNATFGNRADHLTLGLGLSTIKDNFSGQPLLTLSGIKRLSPRLFLISENWVQGIRWDYENTPSTVDREAHLFFSAGTRYLKGKIAGELGLVAYGVLGDGRIQETGEILKTYRDWLMIPWPYMSLIIKL